MKLVIKSYVTKYDFIENSGRFAGTVKNRIEFNKADDCSAEIKLEILFI